MGEREQKPSRGSHLVGAQIFSFHLFFFFLNFFFFLTDTFTRVSRERCYCVRWLWSAVGYDKSFERMMHREIHRWIHGQRTEEEAKNRGEKKSYRPFFTFGVVRRARSKPPSRVNAPSSILHRDFTPTKKWRKKKFSVRKKKSREISKGIFVALFARWLAPARGDSWGLLMRNFSGAGN